MRVLTKIMVCGAIVASFAPESAFAGCIRSRGLGRIDGYSDDRTGVARMRNREDALRSNRVTEFLAEPFVPGNAVDDDKAGPDILAECYRQGYAIGVEQHRTAQRVKRNIRGGLSGVLGDLRSTWDRYVATPFARWLIPTAKDIDFTGAGTGVNVSREADTRTVPSTPSTPSTGGGAAGAGLQRD